MRFPRSKSEAAFLFSFDRLRAISEKLYFWTFTSESSCEDWQFARGWAYFQSRLRKRFDGGLCGLRVFQRFNGWGARHGELHCHAVVNQWVYVRTLRYLARGTGIGQVMKVLEAKSGLEDYLARYMSREGRLEGIRSWARIGCWDHCRVRDVECGGDEANLLRLCYAQFRGNPRAWILARGEFERIRAKGLPNSATHWCSDNVAPGQLNTAS
jgi:hypothetical protein